MWGRNSYGRDVYTCFIRKRLTHIKQYSKKYIIKYYKGYKSLENRTKVRMNGLADIHEVRFGDRMREDKEGCSEGDDTD